MIVISLALAFLQLVAASVFVLEDACSVAGYAAVMTVLPSPITYGKPMMLIEGVRKIMEQSSGLLSPHTRMFLSHLREICMSDTGDRLSCENLYSTFLVTFAFFMLRLVIIRGTNQLLARWEKSKLKRWLLYAAIYLASLLNYSGSGLADSVYALMDTGILLAESYAVNRTHHLTGLVFGRAYLIWLIKLIIGWATSGAGQKIKK